MEQSAAQRHWNCTAGDTFGGKIDPKVIRGAHVWGCPTYVLDPKIQDGKKLPRWQPKSRRTQFLGWFSKRHASTIGGLVRNLKTGAISPQFHVWSMMMRLPLCHHGLRMKMLILRELVGAFNFFESELT
jgi:hypothetical protein